MSGESGSAVDVHAVQWANPAYAGKRLNDQQVRHSYRVLFQTVRSILSRHTPQLQLLNRHVPFLLRSVISPCRTIGAAQLAETSCAAGAVSASALRAPRRPPRNAQHIERYIRGLTLTLPTTVHHLRPRRLYSRVCKEDVSLKKHRDLGLVLF